jgi:hypothetical protein
MANWKNIMTQVGTALGLLTDKMSRLESQRDAARTTLQKARAALQTHLLDGDDGDDKTVAALQAKIDTAQSLLESLDEAVRTQSERVAEAEREASDKETKRQRLAASEIIANDVARIDAQLKPWLAATRALATDLAKYGTARFECGSIGAYLANLAAENGSCSGGFDSRFEGLCDCRCGGPRENTSHAGYGRQDAGAKTASTYDAAFFLVEKYRFLRRTRRQALRAIVNRFRSADWFDHQSDRVWCDPRYG